MNPTSTMDATTDPAPSTVDETVLTVLVDARTGRQVDATASTAVRAAVASAARDASSSDTPEDVRAGFAWATSVITAWCGARVLAVDLDPMALTFDQRTVAALEVTFTVATIEQAHRLAVLLDLPLQPTDPAVVWQTWTGWVSDASAQQPVLVTVTAPTNTPARARLLPAGPLAAVFGES